MKKMKLERNKSGKSIKRINKIKLQRLWALLLAATPTLSFAYSSGGDTLSSILNGLISLLTSGWARLIFIIAVIGVGYATLVMGKLPKGKAASIVIGIGIVFGAAYIAQQLGVGA